VNRSATCWRTHEIGEGELTRLCSATRETDFSKGHLSQILCGKRSPSLAIIVRLARALDVQVVDFFKK
jgi:transcriptional regulator with XRE-family HTH domain